MKRIMQRPRRNPKGYPCIEHGKGGETKITCGKVSMEPEPIEKAVSEQIRSQASYTPGKFAIKITFNEWQALTKLDGIIEKHIEPILYKYPHVDINIEINY